jgi:NAD-dependent dihydropyrimidine dehydrogenase PreA subunit
MRCIVAIDCNSKNGSVNMPRKLTVVVSQGQSANPAKRALEEAIVEAMLFQPGVDVTVIPNLYDLKPDSTGMLCLSGIGTDMVIAAWMYPRAAHWILDRNGIRGRVGPTLLDEQPDEDDEFDEDDAASAAAEDEQDDDKLRVIATRTPPARTIYGLDLRQHTDAKIYIDEIKRLATSTQTEVVSLLDWVGGTPAPSQMQRFVQPTNDTAIGVIASTENKNDTDGLEIRPPASATPTRIDETPDRRWYPVIDYSRCTNCMECIDFCLFGVYGVDKVDTILVEQPDNCRKGCPACSRVCPENAIMFPQHKTPAIAGSVAVDAGGLKIDLSKLFGGDTGETPEQAAARERDEQLVLAGREAVGAAVNMPRRQDGKAKAPKDELDGLIDELDSFDL